MSSPGLTRRSLDTGSSRENVKRAVAEKEVCNESETPPKPQNPNETKRGDGKHMETSRSYGHILWAPMVWPPMV